LHWWFIVASLHEEAKIGSIEVSKAADLIVLDRNLFEVPPHDIHKSKLC
jgi:predicted amidohydrolase YtcJ